MNADNLKKEIKRIKIGHVALLLLGIFVAFSIIGGILLAAGGFTWGRGINFGDYAQIGPGQTYDVNDRAEFDIDGVKRIVISSVSDDAVVVAGRGKAVAELTGRCRSAGGPISLDARRQGDALIIAVKYPMSTSSSMLRFNVTIPESYAGDLSVETVSGKVATGGLPFNLGKVRLHSVSGDVDFSAAGFGELEADTISGDLTIGNITGKVRVGTTSGEVSLDYLAFAETTVRTVSGGVRAAIPQADGFALDFSSTSGSLTSDHEGLGVSHADRSFKGQAHNGTAPFKVSTTSGGLRIIGK